MNFIKTAGFYFLIAIGFTSCQKDVSSFVSDANGRPDETWYSAVTPTMSVVGLQNDLRPTEVSDNFNITNADIIYANGQFTLAVPGNSFVSNTGAVITGNITQRSVLAKSKGDIIRTGRLTMAGDRLLVSGGSIFLDLKRGNDSVFIEQTKKISIKFSTPAATSGMQVYNGGGDVLNGYTWQANTNTNFNHVTATGLGLEVFFNKAQWLQAAYLFDTTGIQQTRLSIKLPSNYTNANTAVFIVFNDMLCVTAAKAVPATKHFESSDLPVNRTVTIVAISKQFGDYYYGSTVVSTSQSALLTPISPTKVSLSTMLGNLSSL